MTKEDRSELLRLMEQAVDEDILVIGGEAVPLLHINIVHVAYKPGSGKILMRLGNALLGDGT